MRYSDTYFRKRSGGRRQDKAGERKYKKGRKEERKKVYACVCGRKVLVCLCVFTSSADTRGVTSELKFNVRTVDSNLISHLKFIQGNVGKLPFNI